MATTTNYGWDTPDDTDLVKDGASAIRTLGSSIDTTTKNLNPQTTTGALAYRSATANVNTALPIGTANQVLRVNSGGTAPEWATSADQTPLTTKGDVFTFSTVDARLGVGANGTVLTADSAEATGLKWAAPAAGGKVLQVVQTVYSTEKAIASTSYTDTDLSASITPSSATSKVLIIVSQQVIQTRSAQDIAGMAIRIYRGATSVYEVAGTDNLYAQYMRATGATAAQLSSILSLVYLDSPSTTSATTYKTMSRLENTTSSANSKFQTAGASSSITLMEIGA
jgi:hypothetical protein